MNDMADLTQLADEWFDVFNAHSKHPFRKKWKTAKHGFGVNYEYQLSILHKFSQVIGNLVVKQKMI